MCVEKNEFFVQIRSNLQLLQQLAARHSWQQNTAEEAVATELLKFTIVYR